MRILLSGSSGFIGKPLLQFLKNRGDEVVSLVRSPSSSAAAICWDPVRGRVCKDDFEGFDAVIHLAGENIGKGRWTKQRKQSIFMSRCRDSWLLSQVLTRLYSPPKTVICASAIGYYGDRGEEILTEESPKGTGFLSDLCERWEGSMQSIERRGSRVVHARFGLVLSPTGGVLKQLLGLSRLCLAGRLGTGKQIVSWIALDDLIGAIGHLLATPVLEGPVNLVAPTTTSQKHLMKTLCRKTKRPMGPPLPAWLLRLLLGEKADALLLSSAHVIPKKLLESGYLFAYPDIDAFILK